MRSLALIGAFLWFLIAGISGCASVPGKTCEEKAQTIDELVVIFQNEKNFKGFMEGEGSATAHLLTDAGGPATFTVAVIRVKPVKLKEQRCLGTLVPTLHHF